MKQSILVKAVDAQDNHRARTRTSILHAKTRLLTWSIRPCQSQHTWRDHAPEMEAMYGFSSRVLLQHRTLVKWDHIKTKVQVYDYIDHQVPVLQRMSEKRMSGYSDMVK